MSPEELIAPIIAHQSQRIEDLEKAFDLATCRLGELEPGDSRAVSDEFVAMAAVLCGLFDHDGSIMKIIDEGLLREKAKSYGGAMF